MRVVSFLSALVSSLLVSVGSQAATFTFNNPNWNHVVIEVRIGNNMADPGANPLYGNITMTKGVSQDIQDPS